MYANLLIIMALSINAKREQFRRDIVRKQKEDYFMARRRQIIQQLESNEHEPNAVEALRQRVDTKAAFEAIRNKLDSVDYFAAIMKYVEEGLIPVLIGMLRDGVEVGEALEVVACVMSKKEEQVRHTGTFYNYGIIQYAVSYLQGSLKCAAHCALILSIYTSHSNDYAELLLTNDQHRLLIDYFMQRVRACVNPQLENDNEGERFYSHVLIVLENLLKVSDSHPDSFQEKKLEIFRFTLMLVERRLFLKATLGVLYQCQFQLKTAVAEAILPQVNQILGEVRTEDGYLHNLFALIYSITRRYKPVPLNFPDFYRVGVLARKVQRPLLKIMELYVESPFAEAVPRNEEWWQSLLASPDNHDCQCLMLKFIDQLGLKDEWVWRVTAAALSELVPSVQHQAIRLLGLRLRRVQAGDTTLENLYKHRIVNILETISHESRTETIREEASALLDFILGPLAQRDLPSI